MTAIHNSVGDYLTGLAVEGKAPRTLEVYGARLRRFADWCAERGNAEPESLSAADLRAYIAIYNQWETATERRGRMQW